MIFSGKTAGTWPMTRRASISISRMFFIPVIDAYDFTYIVFDFENNKWAKFTTTDQVMFKENNSIEEVL